ncbi:MAG: response regulator [Anaerolineae bacterium]|nr:response regulator [Anaerolineae bacterium]
MSYDSALMPGGHIRVLIIPGHDPVGDWMASVVQAEADLVLLGTARNLELAMETVNKLMPDVVLVDIASGILDHVELLNQLAAPASGASVIVVAMGHEVDLVRQAMLVGAHGFLLKPFGETDLLSSIRQAHELIVQRRAQLEKAPHPEVRATEQHRARAPIVGVFSPKGGVGCTTLAVNLAVALVEATGQETILVDADLRFGDVDTALNLASTTTLGTVIAQLDDLDDDLLMHSLIRHKSGIRVLPAPDHIDAADWIEHEDMKRLLRRLAEMGRGYVVVDTWSALNDCTLSILDACDHLLVLTTPQVTALRDVYRFLEVLGLLKYDLGKVWLVLNHCYLPGEVRLKDLERTLGRPITQMIDYAPGPVVNSLNRGVPLVEAYPDAEATRNIIALARRLVAEGRGAESGVPLRSAERAAEKPRKRRLFSARPALGGEVSR